MNPTCETCRRWQSGPPRFKDGAYVASEWNHCTRLFIVTKKRLPFQSGTIVTEVQANRHNLSVAFLNTSPGYSCDDWSQRPGITIQGSADVRSNESDNDFPWYGFGCAPGVLETSIRNEARPATGRITQAVPTPLGAGSGGTRTALDQSQLGVGPDHGTAGIVGVTDGASASRADRSDVPERSGPMPSLAAPARANRERADGVSRARPKKLTPEERKEGRELRKQYFDKTIDECRVAAQYLGATERRLKAMGAWFAANSDQSAWPDYDERIEKYAATEERKNEQRIWFLTTGGEAYRQYGIVVHDYDDYHEIRDLVMQEHKVDYRAKGSTETALRAQWNHWLRIDPEQCPF